MHFHVEMLTLIYAAFRGYFTNIWEIQNRRIDNFTFYFTTILKIQHKEIITSFSKLFCILKKIQFCIGKTLHFVNEKNKHGIFFERIRTHLVKKSISVEILKKCLQTIIMHVRR